MAEGSPLKSLGERPVSKVIKFGFWVNLVEWQAGRQAASLDAGLFVFNEGDAPRGPVAMATTFISAARQYLDNIPSLSCCEAHNVMLIKIRGRLPLTELSCVDSAFRLISYDLLPITKPTSFARNRGFKHWKFECYCFRPLVIHLVSTKQADQSAEHQLCREWECILLTLLAQGSTAAK